jgi:hypothetical protein
MDRVLPPVPVEDGDEHSRRMSLAASGSILHERILLLHTVVWSAGGSDLHQRQRSQGFPRTANALSPEAQQASFPWPDPRMESASSTENPYFTIWAGLPTTTANGGTSQDTTARTPTTAPLPIVTPESIQANPHIILDSNPPFRVGIGATAQEPCTHRISRARIGPVIAPKQGLAPLGIDTYRPVHSPSPSRPTRRPQVGRRSSRLHAQSLAGKHSSQACRCRGFSGATVA